MSVCKEAESGMGSASALSDATSVFHTDCLQQSCLVLL